MLSIGIVLIIQSFIAVSSEVCPRNLACAYSCQVDGDKYTRYSPPYYPFKSELEKEFFKEVPPKRAFPRVSECKTPVAALCGMSERDEDWYDSCLQRLGKHHLFVIPEGRILFCGIPKNGMTNWLKLLRHTFGAPDYNTLPHYKIDKNAVLFSKFKTDTVHAILNDASWKKAVFFRNPAERLLSAYLDKIVSSKGWTLSLDDQTVDKIRLQNFSFFVKNLNKFRHKNQPLMINPHFLPQVEVCGLKYILPIFDFIGNFERLANHSKTLLTQAGIWEKYGASFIHNKQAGGICNPSPSPTVKEIEESNGFMQVSPTKKKQKNRDDHHETDARTQLNTLYNTTGLLDIVQELYYHDQVIWNKLEDNKYGIARGIDFCDGSVLS